MIHLSKILHHPKDSLCGVIKYGCAAGTKCRNYASFRSVPIKTIYYLLDELQIND
jgi:hypothetical protein